MTLFRFYILAHWVFEFDTPDVGHQRKCINNVLGPLFVKQAVVSYILSPACRLQKRLHTISTIYYIQVRDQAREPTFFMGLIIELHIQSLRISVGLVKKIFNLTYMFKYVTFYYGINITNQYFFI